MKKQKIFVIDDEIYIRETVEEALTQEGFSVQVFEHPAEALKLASREMPNLVITDLMMPQYDGLSVIRELKGRNPEVSVLVITGHASLESAIGAIREGASDYLIKPFKIAELNESVRKALSQKRLVPETAIQDKTFHERYLVQNLIGTTPEMKEIFQLITKVAKTDSTILLMGESGTGKEIAARAIHYHSKRRKNPFVSINCAALPETLLESELFGYERGAFTGAQTAKVGLFELAENGTFFLDEIAEMSVNLQAKLLRVLQEKILRRVGGIKDIPVNFRLVAATNRNLPEEINRGTFREDLYYRLNVIPIILPPLRERAEDIPIFIYYFLGQFAKRQDENRQFKMTQDAMKIFQSYRWPGNIRELENVMERLVALTEGDEITRELAENVVAKMNPFSSHFKEPINHATPNLRESVETYERNLIEKAIRETNGNKNKAAQKLNLTRQALQYKLNKYKLAS